MVFQDFNPKDVVVGRSGCGIYEHPANKHLRNLVDQASFGYEAVDKAGKTAIAEKIVTEMLKAGGKFVHVKGQEELTEKQAVSYVKRRFDYMRNTKNGCKKSNSNELDGEAVEQEEDADSFPPAAINHPFAAEDGEVDPTSIASEHDIAPQQEAEVSMLPPLANHDHHHPAIPTTAAAVAVQDLNLCQETELGDFHVVSGNSVSEELLGAQRGANEMPLLANRDHHAAVAQDMNPFQETELEDLLNNTDFLDEYCGEVWKLRQRLSMASDRSEEMAGALVSMVDLAALDGTIDELLYSDQMRACFQSLMLSHKTPKRTKRGDSQQGNHEQQRPAGATDGTKSVVTGGQKSNTVGSTVESIMSLFASNMNFKKDTYIDRVDIVDRRVFKKGEKGEKEYFGTTENGVPHGLGAMIYTKKDKWVVGHWRKGKLHGLGCAIDEDNHRCFGLFVKERLHGKALYKTNESAYLGEYHKHERHGRGKLVDYTKGTFDGHFHKDNFQGKGEYIFPNGDRLIGDFVNWNLESGSMVRNNKDP